MRETGGDLDSKGFIGFIGSIGSIGFGGERLREIGGDWGRFTDHILNEDLQTYSMQIITCSL